MEMENELIGHVEARDRKLKEKNQTETSRYKTFSVSAGVEKVV